MHKLIILIHDSCPAGKFDDNWPQFLSLAEKMPGLVRESTSWVDGMIYGTYGVKKIHELYFESRSDLENAMASPVGEQAGRTLAAITEGHMTLLFAQHQQDEIENIRRYSGKLPADGE